MSALDTVTQEKSYRDYNDTDYKRCVWCDAIIELKRPHKADCEQQLAAAELETLKADKERLLDCYMVNETILPDGSLGVDVMDLVKKLEKAENTLSEYNQTIKEQRRMCPTENDSDDLEDVPDHFWEKDG